MVDSMLGGLFGGPDGDRMRSQARDFVGRYETGAPHEGYDRDEVLDRFRTARGAVNDDDMRDAARQSFGRMDREQRREFKRAMRQRGASGFDDDDDDPEVMAQATQRFMKESPADQGGGGLFGGLFGGGGGSARPAQQDNDLMDNPAVKAAMAGMAAFAMKKILDNR